MSDPRTYTVKQCSPSFSSKSSAGIAQSTNTRKEFFNSIGKLGDLAVLNRNGGNVGKGLRTLATISNSIRTGCGALPTSIGDSLDAGANWVLEQTGIGQAVVGALQGFNPGVANQAYAQARNVYDMVKQGNFKTKDIPYVLQDLQNLERLSRGIFTPSSRDVQSSLRDVCEASPYAMDLIARAPKYKFMFVVQFVPESEYSSLGSDDSGPLNMAFAIKRSSRPKIKYEMEDVNYYNFRSKVVTKSTFEEMDMTFIDDSLNYAMNFYKAYTSATIPITNLEYTESSHLEKSGMNYIDGTMRNNVIRNQIPADSYASSIGTLAGDAKQVFKQIILYHIYDNGNMMNVFTFANPRLTSMSLDELDMSVGTEGCEVQLTFNYDSVYVQTDVPFDSSMSGKIESQQRGATYPLRSNATGTNVPVQSSIPIPSSSTGGSPVCDTQINTKSNNPLISGGGIGGAISATADISTKVSRSIEDLKSLL